MKEVKMVKKKGKKSKTDVLKKDIMHAKKKAEETFKATKDKLVKAEQDIKKYIEKNPKKAAAIATGIGIAIGAVVSSAMKKKR